MEAVLQKNEELKVAAGKAGLTGVAEGEDTSASTSVAETPANQAADEENGTLVRIHASKARLNQICDFMKAIGVSFEIV